MLTETLFQDQSSLINKIAKLEHQSQVNLNSRLDKMNFNDYTESKFNSTKPHKENEISFVTNSSGEISLYKGDTLLSGKGGNLQVTYAYVTDRNRGKGAIEQSVNRRNYYGNDSQYSIYTGPKNNQKLANIIVNGLQVGVDSNFDIERHKDGQSIFATAFAGGLCPYISFNVERLHKNPTTGSSMYRTEKLEYWINLEKITFVSSAQAIKENGMVVPYNYILYYSIKGRRTVSSLSIVQEFDILKLVGDEPEDFFESEYFNHAVLTNGDNVVSCNGIRLACTDVKYVSSSSGELVNPVLTASFKRFLQSGLISENPYVYSTSYLLESEKRPFGLRFNPETGEKMNPPRIRLSGNEKEMAYIVTFKDDEEVK